MRKINLGCDWGTTYTLPAYVNKLDDGIEIKPLSENQIDSIVVKTDSGDYECGVEARECVSGGEADVVYKGFKMLLAEDNEDYLKARQYDADTTPKGVTKMFLEKIIKQALGRVEDCDKINKLVIGVPEIWFKDTNTFDNRAKLEDIVESIRNRDNERLVDDVLLVSEPSCACAYYIHRHKEETGEDFNGKILLVDYGGGTLDIALCDISNNNGVSEISVLERVGSGNNKDEFIGYGGMAYIEAVTKMAIDAEMAPGEESSGEFVQKLHIVETKLKSKTTEIQEVFAELNTRNMDPLKEEVFCKFKYKGKQCVVSYYTLYKAYCDVVEKLFEEKLEEMKAKLGKLGIDYMSNDGNFRIVSVGGFGSFSCVQRQIKKSFAVKIGDKRFNNGVFKDRSECERAVSYGAALIAEGVISFKIVAPYHIGFGNKLLNECMNDDCVDYDNKIKKAVYYAISRGQIIEPNKVYFVGGNKTPSKFFHERGGLGYMLYNTEDEPYEKENIIYGYILENFRNKIRLESSVYYTVGFSFDESLVITLHLQPFKRIGNRNYIPKEYKPIRLDNITAVLGGMIR